MQQRNLKVAPLSYTGSKCFSFNQEVRSPNQVFRSSVPTPLYVLDWERPKSHYSLNKVLRSDRPLSVP
ncbi:hypothetical protein M378DRAFT_167402 [Amanita muscaria Koide BX008]|uniref:Uncharacterized protein n=1 Tax=Amanita muscaria (strain Koide BX008) TaxID=946122 RepID=A0A0C2WXG0_AMAMK|nr:hypothetical protein M378DRAFT_167402 [Amanita muscaria Koide BX008]